MDGRDVSGKCKVEGVVAAFSASVSIADSKLVVTSERDKNSAVLKSSLSLVAEQGKTPKAISNAIPEY